ncbi:MAG TPA: hypothetical protein VHZ55_21020 [Bryobacteraceae bacterium]|jgi:hypothetical protein|nr:hypothetical protein [Bryobacteraceae bacterium]
MKQRTVHLGNVITEWNQQVGYRYVTTLRRRYEWEANKSKSPLEFPGQTGSRSAGQVAETGAVAKSAAQDTGDVSSSTRRTPEEAAAWAKQVSAAVPAIQDAVLLDSYVLEVTALVALLQQMQTSIKKFDTAIAETSRQHPCWEIVQSLPGAEPVMAPRFLAAMENGKRYQNPYEL